METKELVKRDYSQDALKIIEAHRNDLIYVKREDLNTTPLFRPMVSILSATPDDFHKIEGGQMMPKSHHVDAIGNACGVSFIASECGTRQESEFVWVGRAQGRRRQPDGTFRESTAQEYEYNTKTRAEEDFLKNPEKYQTEVSKKRHLLSLIRFARQKAATGARLRVIRELIGMPTSFKPNEISKAMIFSRIEINTEKLLESPDTREFAINQALGVSASMFGPQGSINPKERTVQPEPVRDELPAPEATREPVQEMHEPEPEKSADRLYLEDCLTKYQFSQEQLGKVHAVIETDDHTALEQLAEKIREGVRAGRIKEVARKGGEYGIF